MVNSCVLAVDTLKTAARVSAAADLALTATSTLEFEVPSVYHVEDLLLLRGWGEKMQVFTGCGPHLVSHGLP